MKSRMSSSSASLKKARTSRGTTTTSLSWRPRMSSSSPKTRCKYWSCATSPRPTRARTAVRSTTRTPSATCGSTSPYPSSCASSVTAKSWNASRSPLSSSYRPRRPKWPGARMANRLTWPATATSSRPREKNAATSSAASRSTTRASTRALSVDRSARPNWVVIELPLEILLSLKVVTVPNGEVASFEIELTKGGAHVSWFHGITEIQFSEHVQLAIDGKRQRLMVYDCTVDDANEYWIRVLKRAFPLIKQWTRSRVNAPLYLFLAAIFQMINSVSLVSFGRRTGQLLWRIFRLCHVSFSRCNIPDDQFRQLGFFWEKNGSVALKNFSTLPRTWMIFSSLEMLDCAGLQMRFSSEGGHRCSRFCIQSGMPLVGKSSPNVVLVVFFCLNVGDPQFCLTNWFSGCHKRFHDCQVATGWIKWEGILHFSEEFCLLFGRSEAILRSRRLFHVVFKNRWNSIWICQMAFVGGRWQVMRWLDSTWLRVT